MMRFSASLPMLIVAMLACALLPGIADAATDCRHYAGLANHIAGCIRDTLDDTVYIFFQEIHPMLRRAIYFFLIIAVSVFGVMASFGMLEKVGRDSMMMLLKVSAVMYFVTNSTDIYNFTLLAMDSSAEAVVSFVPTSGRSDATPGSDFSQITCLKNMTNTQGVGRFIWLRTIQRGFYTNSVSGPWMAMDCMVDSVIGIRMPTTTSTGTDKTFNDKLKDDDKGVSRGFAYMFFSTIQSNVVGIAIAIVGLIFIWGVIQLIIKALFIYLAGYIGVGVLVVFAPMFIPLVLFQSTRSYFDKWVKLLISFALQPVIILVFVSLTIAAVDLAAFSGRYSMMYALAGDESQRSGFSLNEYLTRDRGNGKKIIQQEPIEYGRVKADAVKNVQLADATVDSMVKGLENSVCTKALMEGTPRNPKEKEMQEQCKQSYPLHLFRSAFKWDILAEARTPAVQVTSGANTPGEQIMREFMASLIFAAIVVFVMNQLLTAIPKIGNDLLGDFGYTPALSKVGGVLPGQGKLSSAVKSFVTRK